MQDFRDKPPATSLKFRLRASPFAQDDTIVRAFFVNAKIIPSFRGILRKTGDRLRNP